MMKSILLVCGSTFALSWASLAQAQSARQSEPAAAPVAEGKSAASDQVEEIVVTGVRQSLRAGIDTKRRAVQFVDAVVAEDIGKLPDTNVAESLARVSGVQVSRGIGEGVSISIRGLRQNVTLLNGRAVQDATGRGGTGLDSLGSGSYGLLTSIPAELISRLEVTKQPGADQIEGGAGGIVNIVTRRPLDTSGRLVAGSVQAGTNDRWGKASYRAAALWSDTFADDTFGALVNVVYARRNVREDSLFTFAGYTPLTAAFNSNPSGVKFDPNGDGIAGSRISDFRYQRTDDARRRAGANVSLQWRPTKELDFYLESFYAKTETKRDRHWLAFATSGTGSDYDSVVLSPNEVLISGVQRTPLQSNYEFLTINGDTSSTALGGKYQSGRLQVTGEIAYGASKQKLSQYFSRLTTGTVAANTLYPVGFDIGAGDIPSLTLPAALDLNNPNNYFYSNSQDIFATAKAHDWATRVDATLDIDRSGLTSIQAGARFTDTKVSNLQSNTLLGFRRSLAGVESTVSIFRADDLLEGVRSSSLPSSWLAPNRSLYSQGAGCRILQAPTPAACTPGAITPGSTYTVGEDAWAAYVKLNLEFDLGGIAASGNVGARYVDTQVTSVGNLLLPTGAAQPITAKVQDGRLLPTAVLKLDLTDSLVARFGAARVAARPNTAALNNGTTVTGVPSASAGNPYLKPFVVDQYDASLEWYFGQASMFSLGLFYKDVKSFVLTAVQDEVLPGFTAAMPVSRQRNVEGGKIQGVEILYQQPFTFLPAPFDGFGVVGTYSYIESKTPLVDGVSRQNLPIEGLSKNNINLIGYYEKGPVSIRVAYNWRDRFFNVVGLNNAGVFYDDFSDLSSTVKYTVNRNIELELEATNLLDDGLRRYAGFKEATQSFAVSGRTYSLTMRAKF